MKTILPIYFLLLFFTAQSQESITLKFTRPQSAQGSEDKIQISVQNNDYLIKNGNTISVNVTPNFGTSLKIDCSVSSGLQTSYFLDPKSGQTYEFEVGFKMSGIYIKLLSGEEANQGGVAQPVEPKKDDSQTSTKLNVDRKSKGVGVTFEKTNNSSVRDEWLKRGGIVNYNSIMLTGTYFNMDLSKLGLKTSPGVKFPSSISGYGGGYSIYTNFVNLKMPEYTTGLSKWNSFNWGLGFDFVIYSFKLPTSKYTLSGYTYTMDMSAISMDMMIVGNFGWTLGQGRYIDEGTWKGVVFTLKYRPTFNLNYNGMTTTMKITPSVPGAPTGTTSSSSSSTDFNAKGFGFDIDFTSFSATMDRLAPRPKSKFSFFMLPPVGKSPLFISISFGMVMYPKKHAHRSGMNK